VTLPSPQRSAPTPRWYHQCAHCAADAENILVSYQMAAAALGFAGSRGKVPLSWVSLAVPGSRAWWPGPSTLPVKGLFLIDAGPEGPCLMARAERTGTMPRPVRGFFLWGRPWRKARVGVEVKAEVKVQRASQMAEKANVMAINDNPVRQQKPSCQQRRSCAPGALAHLIRRELRQWDKSGG
jgi:hypothetical protein